MTNTDVDPPSSLLPSQLTWLSYIPRIPYALEDIAWHIEHAWHFYGDPIPLVRNRYVSIFECGGLHLLWQPEGRQLFVADHGVSLEQLMETNGNTGVSLRFPDELADSVAERYYGLWDWERAECGRNRWQELEQRGGDVHPAWTSNAPSPYSW